MLFRCFGDGQLLNGAKGRSLSQVAHATAAQAESDQAVPLEEALAILNITALDSAKQKELMLLCTGLGQPVYGKNCSVD